MDSDTFRSIHTLNMDEWIKFRGYWEDYIRFLDLGIINFGMHLICTKIIDEKNWLLTRLKYGI